VKRAKALAGSDDKRGPVIVSDKTKRDEEERRKLKERDERKRFREVVNRKRDPKRSVYYDEVWNPYGVPPPGVPWRERDEVDEDGMSSFDRDALQ
jgi:mRNA biogenesis factor